MSAQKHNVVTVPRIFLVVLLSLVLAVQFGCGGEDDPTPTGPGPNIEEPPDTIPPAAVADLHIQAPTFESVALVWNAPGDDGATGTATQYDIRYAKFEIDDTTWDQATAVIPSRIPPPQEAGKIETIVIMDLDSGSDYWFALKAADEEDNTSGLSNIATARTKDESFPPSDITDLRAVGTATLDYDLIFTSPGDDYAAGTASAYDIRYSRTPILSEASWEDASVYAQAYRPKPSGELDTLGVTVLIEDGLYFFAMKTVDELDNWSGLSNMAQALGVNFDLSFSPGVLRPGDITYIMFRSSPDLLTRVAIQDYAYGGIYCGDNVFDYLVSETLEEGIYSVTYDFIDDETGKYLPYDYYYLTLCHGGHMIEYKWIYFVDPDAASSDLPSLDR